MSRVRMDPLRDHSAVGLQQGRVLPDGDLNELVDIIDRRLRAQVADQRAAGVAFVSAVTPDAFLVAGSTPGGLTVECGRMYVDGLLAENHGNPAGPAFDPVLAEPSYAGNIAYDAQPYWPTPAPLPSLGTHLAYLDVWQRELTHLNAPDLVEPAIGVDTTTRTQTVWQVRLLENVGDKATCGDSFAGWDDLIAPSGARLTTGAVAVDADDDPCELPPAGGYRGLENHLYRVELHDAGTFKWSRHNASIASRVVEVVSSTELRLARLRRDDLLRFAEGDWVEVLDDHRELNRLPGELRKITLDEGASTIGFTDPLPADLLPSGNGDDTVEARHLRVVLWSQRGSDIDAAGGVVPVPAAGTQVVLEHGIAVEFGGAAGRSGDYWVFAARTTDASVEALVNAPPRGIHHHYARLALVTATGASDCRPSGPEPSGGCRCETCVTPESHESGALTIQEAVDRAVAAGGGTVTLCPGTYRLREPVRLRDAAFVDLRGTGATLVADGPALVALKARGCSMSGFAVLSTGSGPAVALASCWRVLVEDVSVVAHSPEEKEPRIGIALLGPHIETTLRHNVVDAHVGIGTMPFDTSEGLATLAAPTGRGSLLTLGLRIEDNTLRCTWRGIDLTGTAIHFGELRIAANMVFASTDAAIATTGLVARGSAGIDGVLAVSGNVVEIAGGYGILTSGRAVIDDNELTSNEAVPDRHAVLVGYEARDEQPGTVRITGNRATGFGGYGVVVEAPTASLIVKSNVVERCGGGVAVRRPGEHVAIDNNHVIEVTDPGGERPARGTLPVVYGIHVTGVGAGHVVGNIVDGVATEAQGAWAIGIMVLTADDLRVDDNTVLRVVSAGTRGRSIGIGVASVARALTVRDNAVHRTPEGAPENSPGWQALVVVGSGSGDAGNSRVVTTKNSEVAMDGDRVHVKDASTTTAPLQVVGNRLGGGGALPAVHLIGRNDVLLSGNHVSQPRDTERPAIETASPAAIVNGNRAVGGGQPSIRIGTSPKLSVVIGNMTSGDITVDGVPVSQTGMPWAELNPVVP